MRFAGSTFSFMWRAPALASLRSMAQIGLTDFDVLLVPGHLWFDLGSTERRELRATLAAEGLRLDSLNPPAIDLNLASMVPEMRTQSVDTYTKAIDLAADLNARAVVVVPGRVSALLPPPRDAVLGHLTEASQTLLERAERHHIQLFFELHPQTPLPTTEVLGPWIDALEAPNAWIAYDVANARFVAEDSVSAIRSWHRIIGQYHVSDSTGTRWRHDPLGMGDVPIDDIIDAVEATAFSGACVLEIISQDPVGDMAAGMDLVRTRQEKNRHTGGDKGPHVAEHEGRGRASQQASPGD